jgi:hypothetical protein
VDKRFIYASLIALLVLFLVYALWRAQKVNESYMYPRFAPDPAGDLEPEPRMLKIGEGLTARDLEDEVKGYKKFILPLNGKIEPVTPEETAETGFIYKVTKI